MRRSVSDILAIMALAGVYLLVARLGLALDAVGGFATLVWPPSGICLAAILLRGRRVWPGIFIGAAAANILAGASVMVAVGIASGNTLEAIAGAYLLRRVPHFRTSLENVASVVGLVTLSAVLSTLLSATVGVTSLYLGGAITRPHLGDAWRAWWIGDMVGALIVAPIILVWATRPHAHFRPHFVERVALPMAVLVVSVTTFFGG